MEIVISFKKKNQCLLSDMLKSLNKKSNALKIEIDIMLVPLFCILQTAVGAC